VRPSTGLTLTVAVVAGIVSGLAGSRLAVHRDGSAPSSRLVDQPPLAAPARPDSVELERRIEARILDKLSEQPTSPTETPGDDGGALFDPEAERTQTRARFEKQIEAHRAEARDTSWARAAEEQISVGLEAGEQNGEYRMIGLDCRTTSCAATLEWPNYSVAVAKFKNALWQVTEQNCARHILLPEPADRDAAYQAQMMMDCTDQRAGLVTEAAPDPH
jgi:hypothetical protein